MNDPARFHALWFSGESLSALTALLALVHYDDLAQSWFETLPSELQTKVKDMVNGS